MKSLVRSVVAVALFIGIAALLVRQPSFGALPFIATSHADPARLRQHVLFLADEVAPRDIQHPDNLERAASYIADALTAAGGRLESQPFTARGARYRNLSARFGLEGLDRIVVGAHYDAFGDFGANPGADDNASGVAGLLELARILGKQAVPRPIELVAFSTEEPPCFASQPMGSAVHARNLRQTGTRVQAMLCLEMIGYYTPRQAWPSLLFRLVYPSSGEFVAVVGRWQDRALARRVKSAMQGAGGVDVYSYSGPSIPGIDASDHRNYWANGFAAVLVTDTAFLRNPNYHAPGDRPETLDYERMARVVDGVANAVLQPAGR
ncbi:MAG: M28 family peptidase [Acidobacteriota bacterium]